MTRLFALTLTLIFLLQAALPQPVLAQGKLVLEPGTSIELAQRKKRRSLMDMLFGNEPEQVAPPPVVKKPRPPPVAQLPPPTPKVDKAATATRLAVIGDSMAEDLAEALERFYAEDPNLSVVNLSVGSSGFVRDDYFNWNKVIGEQIAAQSFDIAVVFIGVNDRQPIAKDKPLTEPWSLAYRARVDDFLNQLRLASKPVIWVGLPPMKGKSFAADMGQIASLQRLSTFSGGAEFLDTYERFLNEEGTYSSYGPNLNGERVLMRKEDGIHFTGAGADKLAFYLSSSIRLFYRGGGGVSIEVADPLAGTDAGGMLRPPYQGLGQIRLLEVAGAVMPLTQVNRAADLIVGTPVADEGEEAGFDLRALMNAPVGRVDAFGVGVVKTPEVEGAAP